MEIQNSRTIDYATPSKDAEIPIPKNLTAKTNIFTREIPVFGSLPQGKAPITLSFLHSRMQAERTRERNIEKIERCRAERKRARLEA